MRSFLQQRAGEWQRQRQRQRWQDCQHSHGLGSLAAAVTRPSGCRQLEVRPAVELTSYCTQSSPQQLVGAVDDGTVVGGQHGGVQRPAAQVEAGCDLARCRGRAVSKAATVMRQTMQPRQHGRLRQAGSTHSCMKVRMQATALSCRAHHVEHVFAAGVAATRTVTISRA